MRIVSWNVNGIRAGVRHGFVDFVGQSGADIVGGVQDPEHHDGARDTRWRDDRMTGRRSHGRLSALNGVVHQGSVTVERPLYLCDQMTLKDKARFLDACPHRFGGKHE